MTNTLAAKQLKFILSTCFAIFLLVIIGTAPVWAHDMDAGDFELFDMSVVQLPEHVDAVPYKGTLTLTVTNSTSSAWTDFHFMIFMGEAVFDVTAVPPSWDRGAGLSWDLGADPQTLDLYFVSNPVAIGEDVTFNIYTDNTAPPQNNFAVGFYPTNSVPIPSAIWLMGSALVGLVGIRKRFSKS